MLATPPFAYSATAVRPSWGDLSADLRAAIEGRLGSPVVGAAVAGAGFTSGFAGLLTTAAGDRVFVKAARSADQRHLCDWYAHEALVTAALPPSVRAPRPLWTLATPDFFVLCAEAVEGRTPALPWQPAELTATLDAWSTAAAALADPPPALLDLRLPALAPMIADEFGGWRWMADGKVPLPPSASAARDLLPALAALESGAAALVTTAGPELTHCDLRLDNVIIDPDGRAWIVDWNWLCHGPAWFDTAVLLITAYAGGLDADQLWSSHPTATDAPPGALDGALAALSGYFLTRGAAPLNDAAPTVRAHQTWHGEVALTWLAARQGWDLTL
ncbi:phosphotransferase [Asanoa sp. WMMD1127]|uniref:phosphotransferase n=1 Tax=Asanoa sp. WMMD1127 TaxID=3016107 RepID=UPI0024166D0C|nr:phosphotransferase [Asanoa sp. WMMD1127]MDG4827621.1 phosphotransferase [Asanoa sp. WMMD1127]